MFNLLNSTLLKIEVFRSDQLVGDKGYIFISFLSVLLSLC